MLSDGKIENAEREFFKRLLAAFGQSEDTFKSYYQVLFLKNERPLDRRQEIKKAEQEIPSEIAKKEKTSAIFDRKFLVETEKSSNEDFKKTDTSKGKDTKASLDKSNLESTISREMLTKRMIHPPAMLRSRLPALLSIENLTKTAPMRALTK